MSLLKFAEDNPEISILAIVVLSMVAMSFSTAEPKTDCDNGRLVVTYDGRAWHQYLDRDGKPVSCHAP